MYVQILNLSNLMLAIIVFFSCFFELVSNNYFSKSLCIIEGALKLFAININFVSCVYIFKKTYNLCFDHSLRRLESEVIHNMKRKLSR